MNFRSDLALEAREILPGDPPGVRMSEEDFGDARITRVEVLDERGEHALGKPRGTYITLESARLWRRNGEDLPDLANLIARELRSVLPDTGGDKPVLIIGLGNRHITADALGPQAVEKVLVTRPLTPEQRGETLRPVCAFAPGVMGVTGIESFEAVQGLCRQVDPCAVIAIDALAARRSRRILTTVQISDSGIAPGSGLGGRTRGLSRESLGVPVVAVGVPMVVYAATIAWDAMEHLTKTLRSSGGEGIASLLGSLPPDELEALVRDMTAQAVGDLVVAPKEIDEAVAQVAQAVAAGVNLALHPKISFEDMLAMQG